MSHARVETGNEFAQTQGRRTSGLDTKDAQEADRAKIPGRAATSA